MNTFRVEIRVAGGVARAISTALETERSQDGESEVSIERAEDPERGTVPAAGTVPKRASAEMAWAIPTHARLCLTKRSGITSASSLALQPTGAAEA